MLTLKVAKTKENRSMRSPIYLAIARLSSEKEIPEEIIIEALESSLVSAYKKDFGINQEVRVSFDKELGDFVVWQIKKITKKPTDLVCEISLEEAKKLNPEAKIGNEIEINVTPAEFGRIAIQTAKQVIMQKIREVEKEVIYKEFLDQQHKLIQGTIIRREGNTLYLDLGKGEGMLSYKDQIPSERYFLGQVLRVVVLDVLPASKENKIIVSRAHPEFLARMFELEVPEIIQGSVVIKKIAREAGTRSKVAVEATSDGVDPVGACVGQKGVRIKAINEELGEEKIDIIPYSENLGVFISNALSPAKVSKVEVNEEKKSALVWVDEKNLSLAIGKRGQNVRIASKLVGYDIEIRSALNTTAEEAVKAETVTSKEQLEKAAPVEQADFLEPKDAVEKSEEKPEASKKKNKKASTKTANENNDK